MDRDIRVGLFPIFPAVTGAFDEERFHRAVHSVPFAVDKQADLLGGVAGPKSAAPDSGKYRPPVEAALAVEGG